MKEWLYRFENPVFVKEMRVGFREKKVFYALVAWVLIVALFASVMSLGAFNESMNLDELPEAGKFFLEGLFWVQITLLGFLAPSLTTSAVSGERERNNFDMLLTTHLTPAKLVAGKLGFAVSFVALALFSTVPLESVVFFLGGVSLWSFVSSKLLLLAFGVLCTLFGLMMSARETRSAYATGQTYFVLCFFGMFGVTGLAVMRYEGAPFAVVAGAWLCAIYLTLFLFWKSVNNVEDRARHLKILLSIGLVFYLAMFALVGGSQWYYPHFDDEIWLLSAPVHYVLFGLLLNPMRPSRAIEKVRFDNSFLSRPFFWIVVLYLGLLGPLSFCKSDAAIAMCSYVGIAALGTTWFVRGLSLSRPERYPYLLGMSWSLLILVPALTGVSGLSAESHSFHPATLSPFTMFFEYTDQHHISSFPILATFFYFALFAIGQSRHLAFRRKLALAQKPQES